MQPYQQRVVDEYNALEIKVSDLFKFLKTPLFTELCDKDQSLLREQYMAMQSYLTMLGHRIDRFEN